jgi:hypothetical protein
MTVYILVTVPDPQFYDACTLVFDSLRVGFPTATVRVKINGLRTPHSLHDKIFCRAFNAGAEVHIESDRILHHADWIRTTLEDHAEYEAGPCVILDADVAFWSSCEGWKFDTLLAGYHVPLMWNDFSQCISFERLHTSFLYVRDAGELFARIETAYPNAQKRDGDYCPFDAFMPRVEFIHGIPFFYDSTAALYAAIGGTHFGEEHKACFTHLNSASFYETMHERLENKVGFENLHKVYATDPQKYLRGWWTVVDQYYIEKYRQAVEFLDKLGQTGVPALRSLKVLLQ